VAVILVVDDDSAMRDALREAVIDLGFEARLAASGEAALALLAESRVDAALLDFRMAGMDGLELLARIRTLQKPPPVTVLTAHATAYNTIEAMRLGAFDHLTKPIGRDALSQVLNAMLGTRAHESQPAEPTSGAELIGSSESIRVVQKAIGRLADGDATVLISGETGTGKELVARAIHDHGARAQKPFIAVNCAAIPAELMETELFGHVRGAYSGAIRDRVGAFREAHGGTLFLDEIGDMDPAMQAKILRALQERVVIPVGGASCRFDARIIAATHRDLPKRIAEGAFREDLFYRLNVVPIHLPPLRDRPADIVLLAEHFLASTGSGKRLTPAAIATLVAHSWPGNVRELKNVMERFSIGRTADIDASEVLSVCGALPRSAGTDWPDEDLPSATLRLEEMLIRRALGRCGGNRAEAARHLNIHRQLLYTKMKRLGIEVSDDKTMGVAEADAPPAATRRK
jgi:two-component system NtrC family response regulator